MIIKFKTDSEHVIGLRIRYQIWNTISDSGHVGRIRIEHCYRRQKLDFPGYCKSAQYQIQDLYKTSEQTSFGTHDQFRDT